MLTHCRGLYSAPLLEMVVSWLGPPASHKTCALRLSSSHRARISALLTGSGFEFAPACICGSPATSSWWNAWPEVRDLDRPARFSVAGVVFARLNACRLYLLPFNRSKRLNEDSVKAIAAQLSECRRLVLKYNKDIHACCGVILMVLLAKEARCGSSHD